MLAVEDARDLRVGVEGGEPADQVDGVLVGAEPARGRAAEGDCQLGDRAAFPAQDEIGAAVLGVAASADPATTSSTQTLSREWHRPLESYVR